MKKINSNDLCVFVSSPNEYADMFEIFYKCFRKYWADCPYEFIFVTNSQTYPDLTVYNNHSDGDTWMDRALPVLKQLTYKYVLILWDDFFLCEKVDNQYVEDVIVAMEKNGIVSCRPSISGKIKKIEGTKDIVLLHTKTPYANALGGIFEREYLIHELEDGCKSIWDVERKWLREALSVEGYYPDVAGCTTPLLSYIHGMEKGLWIPSALDKLKTIDVEVVPKRGCISRTDELIQMTKRHVGKLLSPRIRTIVKKYLRKVGFHFVTDN